MPAKIIMEYTEQELKELIQRDIEERLNTTVDMSDIQILVKSKQNYRSEWEKAEFRAMYSNTTERSNAIISQARRVRF